MLMDRRRSSTHQPLLHPANDSLDPALPPSHSTTAADDGTDALAAKDKGKRKEPVVGEAEAAQENGEAAAPVARVTRSRQSIGSTSAAQQPSAKSLGKRRAVSPSPGPETNPAAPAPVDADTAAEPPRKKRRTVVKSPKNYNLRSRASRGNSSSSHPAGKGSRMPKKGTKGRTSASGGSPVPGASSSTTSSSAPAGRSKTKRRQPAPPSAPASPVKEKAVLGGCADDPAAEDCDALMGEADAGPSSSHGAASTVGDAKEEGAILVASGDQPMAAASLDGEDAMQLQLQGEEADSDSNSESGDDGEDDGEDDEENEVVDHGEGLILQDDDEMDDEDDGGDEELDFEDPYASGGDGMDELPPPPRTFDADGDQLETSNTLRERSSSDDAIHNALFGAAGAAGGAAAAGALAGAGGGLGGYRVIQNYMSGMSTRLKGLLTTLKATDKDASAKLTALQDLAEILSVSTEDTLAGYFQVESFSKELVTILKGEVVVSGGGAGMEEDNGGMTREEMIAFGLPVPDVMEGSGAVDEESHVQMMLLACRCLANLMEALPGSAHSIVYAGAVPVLCSKLLEIQYIDLAEQTLSTLEKISEEMPGAIVRGGGLSALLTYLDFFSFHVQRTAVTAAANCCRSLAPDSFGMVKDAMPIFRNILGYPDQRVVEQGCLAIVRITESYKHYPDKLEALLTSEVLVSINALLNPDSSTVAPATYTEILKMLTTASKASPAVALALLELGIANTLSHLLVGVSPPTEGDISDGVDVRDDRLVMRTLVQRPKEQIQETLGLLCELLPPLPKDGIFDAKAFTRKKKDKAIQIPAVEAVKREELSPQLFGGTSSDAEGAAAGPSTGASGSGPGAGRISRPPSPLKDVKMETADDGVPAVAAAPLQRSSSSIRAAAKEALAEKRLDMLRSGGEARQVLLKRFFTLLLPTLVDVYSASVNSTIRTKTVTGMLKIVHFCDTDALAKILKGVPMSSFLAAILSAPDQSASINSALQLVELLLTKLPEAYPYIFRREGVLHEIERIASEPILYVSSKHKSGSSAATPSVDPVAAEPVPPPSGLTRALQNTVSDGTSSDAPQVPAKSTLSSAEQQARDANTYRARHLWDKYGGADSAHAARAKAALEQVTDIVKRLQDPPALDGKLDEAATAELLGRLSEMTANHDDPMTSFEVLESGLISGLLAYATDPQSPTEVHRRQQLFARAFNPNGGFTVLVKRLQESLSRMEEFQVVLATPGAAGLESKRSSGASMLARQLRLRLVAEDGTEVPRSCTNIVVSIHAIATFQAFNDYLRPRILSGTAAERSAASTSAPSGSKLASTSGAAARLSSSLSSSSDTAILNTLKAMADSLGAEADTSTDTVAVGTPPTASTSQASNSAAATAKEDGAPSRRRSMRLAKTTTGASDVATAGSSASEKDAGAPPADDLFESAIEPPQPPSRDDRPINFEFGEDAKMVAKTPDGTRVATPTLAPAQGTSKTVEACSPAAASSSRPIPTPAKPRASYAAAVKAEPTDFHLEFTLGDADVDLSTTVFGAIHQHESLTPNSGRNLWNSVYTVKYRKVPGPATSSDEEDGPISPARKSVLDEAGVPASIAADSRQAKILLLLRVLYSLNAEYAEQVTIGDAKALDDSAFINNKLTAKLNRQLEEPMIVASACLPDWSIDLPQSFPFLFPFDARHAFLQSTSFGYARLVQKWIGQPRGNDASGRREENLGFLGRLQRQKVRISRERILDSAFKIFELYGGSRASLEVEFFQEVGSGLGPTLEFYALVSKEFAQKELGAWRDDDPDNGSAYVSTKLGLFPRPLDDEESVAGKKQLKVFKILGQVVAKAFMDSRIIDLHFNRMFMKLVLGKESVLSVASVKAVDPPLAKSLAHLQLYVDRASGKQVEKELGPIEDLGLDFTLPGYSIDLKAGGSDIDVTEDNVAEYISLVVEWTLKRGVAAQVREFKEGFSTVFPVKDLRCFTEDELVVMTGAGEEDWSIETLVTATKADHGFTMDSLPVRDLLTVLSELNTEDRRQALSFITGSPRLPIGGFSALSPALTIVRKDGGDKALPSVMTCVNYVKLPQYSKRELLEERFRTAIAEGSGGFHLS